MKQLVLLLVLAGWLAVPESQAQIRDSLLYVVAPFDVPAGNAYWWDRGTSAMQDMFVAELARESGASAVDGMNARRPARRPARYRVSGAVVEYGKNDRGAYAVVRAQANATATGKVVWKDEVRYDLNGFKGSDEELQAMFDKVMKPALLRLTASLNEANL